MRVKHSDTENEVLVPRGRIMVPVGWLVTVVGIAGSGFLLAFFTGIWVSTISVESKATSARVQKLEDGELSGRVIRIETILSMVYPDQAKEAKRILAIPGDGSKGN